jgi:hypothetical protein
VIGDVRHVARFPSRDHFAACNSTDPVEVSSGGRKVYWLSLRGNRRLNHAIHMAAISQIWHKHSQGRACYDKKLAEGKTRKGALRCLKRRISDAIYAALVADARQGSGRLRGGPGRATGEPLHLPGGRLTPRTPALRASHSRACHHHRARRYRRSRTRSAGPSPSAPGRATPGRIEEIPANHLTPPAKRTRYACLRWYAFHG